MIDFNKSSISPQMRLSLEKMAEWFLAHPKVEVEVEGHADKRGTPEYNLALGERRAKAVMDLLIQLGVNPSRFSMVSYGKGKQICVEQSDACHQMNRRVHFDLK